MAFLESRREGEVLGLTLQGEWNAASLRQILAEQAALDLAGVRRARLFTDKLSRDDEALDTWQRVLDIDFANVAALRAVSAVWRRRKDPAPDRTS